MRNQIFTYLLLTAFFLSPPLMLAFRLWKRTPNWWIICLSLSLISWLCMNGTVYLHFAGIDQKMAELEAAGDPIPDDLMESFASDGAPKVFALFLGWLYIVPFFIAWLIPFGIIQLIRRIRTKNLENPAAS